MRRTIAPKLMAGAVTVFLLLLACTFALASELDEIKAALGKKGARWVAGETSVSRLSPQLRRLRLGLIKPELTGAEEFVSVTPPATGLSPSLDWSNYVTPVRDQGNCGSCWAFATTGALESFSLIKGNISYQNDNFAEQVLVSCSKAGSCSGGYIDKASSFIRDTGLPLESCYPYTATNGKCAKACPNWQFDTYGIGSWAYVATTAPKVDALKTALNTYGPLVTTMDVYTDFFSYTGGIYSHAWGTREGGHAVLITGYDDSGQYFIVKNSWGTDWGESGFFRIAYSQLANLVKFGYYTLAYHPEGICTYSISPTGQSFPAAGGQGTIYVTAGAICSWNASSNAPWITIISGFSDTGKGQIVYSVAPNPSKTSRTGTITVAGSLQFTVTQQRSR